MFALSEAFGRLPVLGHALKVANQLHINFGGRHGAKYSTSTLAAFGHLEMGAAYDGLNPQPGDGGWFGNGRRHRARLVVDGDGIGQAVL